MKHGFPALVLLMVIGLGACASFRPPPSMEPGAGGPEERVGILPPESTLFASFKVDSFHFLLAPLFPNERSQKLLDHTDRVYGGITLTEAGDAAFSLVGIGDYSSAHLRIPLCLSRDWRRVDRSYWVQEEKSLQIALPEKNLLLASNGSIRELLARYDQRFVYPLPPGVGGRMEAAELLLFFPVLPAVARDLEVLPMKAAWLEAAREGEDLRISIVMALQDPDALAEAADRRRVEALFRLALAIWLRRENRADLAGRFGDLEIRTEDGLLRLEGIRLSRQEIESLLERFLQLEEGGL
jgi:hypothetical protein